MVKRITFCVFCFLSLSVWGQPNVHPQSVQYEWPGDKKVRQKLDQWQDMKFGMIIHWGLYSVPGMIESWALCSEDWIERDSTVSYEDFKKWYWGLSRKFNPVRFDPEQWAEAGRRAGMKYVVFTTKHHDGFCMFNTRETDFNIAQGPFRNNPRADVAKYVFDAFRKRNFMVGAYFSKPDWHSEYYWWPKYATPDRNNNYDIRKHPWRWSKFKEYTYNQIKELVQNYGSIDILWLDGGWVRPSETVNEEVRSWGAAIPLWSQDIDMPRIATMAREAQPGILIVDRTVHGPYENYQTPEQKIPEKQLDYPWESCMTLGNAWGFVPDDQYKSASRVIHSLVEVVAKGGSLLLGIGPGPDGTLPVEVISRLNEIGKWTAVNGRAIFNTRSVAMYRDDNVWFTQSKDGKVRYAIVCMEEGQTISKEITWRGNVPAKGTKVTESESGKAIKWITRGNRVTLYLPPSVRSRCEGSAALTFAFSPERIAGK